MKKVICILLTLAMVFAMLPAQTLADVPAGATNLNLYSDGDWLKSTQVIDHTKDFEISMDIDFAKINESVSNDSWQDTMDIYIKSSSANICFGLQTYKNGSGKYQFALSPKYNGDDGTRIFSWSIGDYDNPTKHVSLVLKYNSTYNEYTWIASDRDLGTAIHIGSYPSSYLQDALVKDNNCRIEIYKNDAGTSVSNAYIKNTFSEVEFSYDDATSLTFNNDNPARPCSTVNIDNSKGYTLGCDIDFKGISTSSSSGFVDRGRLVIRNTATDEYVSFYISTYKTGGGEYQLHVDHQTLTKESSNYKWSPNTNIWSANYKTPIRSIHFAVEHDVDTLDYSWKIYNRYTGQEIISGTLSGSYLSDTLKDCKSCELALGVESGSIDISNGYINYTCPRIKNAALVLNDSLSFIVYATVPSSVTNPSMKFTRNGNVTTAIGKNEGSGLWSFVDDDIYATSMTDSIQMDLLNDSKEVIDTINYSVKDYCDSILASSEYDEKTKDLVKAVLVYGSEAMKYNKKSGIANYNIGETIADELAVKFDISSATSDFSNAGSPSTENKMKSAILNIGNKISIVFKYVAAAGTVIKVNNVDVTDKAEATGNTNEYTVTFDEISPTDYDKVFTAELVVGGSTVQTVKYSANSYCIKQQSNANVGNLAKAIYMYGRAAEAYIVK